MIRSVLIKGIFIFCLVIYGCSTSSTPTHPAIPDLDIPVVNAQQQAVNHMCWGFYQVEIDAETLTAVVVPSRTSMFNANVVQFLQPPFSPDHMLTFKILAGSDPSTGYFEVEVSIKHPFSELPMYRGFDVRGILITDGSYEAVREGLTYSGDGDAFLMNADGWTRWWNAEEFTTYNTVFGYTPGKLAPPVFPDSTLNGYKYFADDLGINENMDNLDPSTRGTFSNTSTNSRRYDIQFEMYGGSPDFMFNYAIDACWEDPDPSGAPNFPLDSFSLNANCQEAYWMNANFSESTAWYVDPSQNGGDLHVALEIGDWGALEDGVIVNDEVAAIWIESDTLGIDPVNVYPMALVTQGNGSSTQIFTFDITGVSPSGLEDQALLISVVASGPPDYEPQTPGGGNFDYPAEPLTAYMFTDVPITNVPPSGWLTVTSIDPDQGELDTGNISVEVAGTNFATDAYVQLIKTDDPDVVLDATGEDVNIDGNLIDCVIDLDTADGALEGNYHVSVTNPGPPEVSGQLDEGFAIYVQALQPPTVLSIVPDNGDLDSGNLAVQVNGTDFSSTAYVQLIKSTNPSVILEASGETVNGMGTLIDCTLDLDSSDGAEEGVYHVKVTNPGSPDLSDQLDNAFTINPPANVTPTVTGIDPDSGEIDSGDLPVTVSGYDFNSNAYVELVKNDNPSVVIAATGESVNGAGTEIDCDVNLDTSNGAEIGTYHVKVTNPGSPDLSGQLNNGFNIESPSNPAPEVTGIDPDEGVLDSGMLGVQVSGSNFAADAYVELEKNDDPAVVLQATGETTGGGGTYIDCDLNMNSAAGAEAGIYDVRVVNPGSQDQTGQLDNGFRIHLYDGCNEVYEDYTYAGTFVGSDSTGRSLDLAFTNDGFCLSKYYPYPRHALYKYDITQNGNVNGTEVIPNMQYGSNAMMGIDVDDSSGSSRGNIVYFTSNYTVRNNFYAYTEDGTYIGEFVNPNTSRINALDTDDDGGLWVVGDNTYPSYHCYINHWTWNGSTYVYDAANSIDDTTHLRYKSSGIFYFDCAVAYQEEKLMVFCPGASNTGLVLYYDISSGTPVWDRSLDAFLPYTLYNAQYGNYWFYGSDIEVDHSSSSDEFCRVLVMAANSTGATFVKLDVDGNILDIRNTDSTTERFNAIAIYPFDSGVNGSCIVGNRLSTYNMYYRTYLAPSDW